MVAITLDEPEAPEFERRIARDPVRLISAVTMFELAIVIEARLGERGGQELDRWLATISADVRSVTLKHANDAREAWRRFGRGRHPASQNFGDCFSYALAIATGEALLYKGDDFARTDVRAA